MRNSSRAATLSLKGRVDFTCLLRCNQIHFASVVGHGLVDSVPSWRRVSCEQQVDSQFIWNHFEEIGVFQTCAWLVLSRTCVFCANALLRPGRMFPLFPSDRVVMVSVQTFNTPPPPLLPLNWCREQHGLAHSPRASGSNCWCFGESSSSS